MLKKNEMKNKGNIEKGFVKKSNGQIKKHISQMTLKEVNYLNEILNKISKEDIVLSNHILDKDISFKREYISEIIEDKNKEKMIIEYNETERYNKIDKRVVLRDTREREVLLNTRNGKEKALANLCIVLSLNTNRVITAYWNKVTDTHRSMDWARYTKSLEIC